MANSTVLGGRVWKRALPVMDGRPNADAPPLKRLALAKGELAQIHDGEPGIRYVALIELRPGCVRGNHYHRAKEELIYVITGELVLAVEDPQTRERALLTMSAGDLAFIPIEVAHALQPLHPGHAVELSPTPFDEADIHPYPLLQGRPPPRASYPPGNPRQPPG
jgi:quercetin dioxygenase-like cupin family protein